MPDIFNQSTAAGTANFLRNEAPELVTMTSDDRKKVEPTLRFKLHPVVCAGCDLKKLYKNIV